MNHLLFTLGVFDLFTMLYPYAPYIFISAYLILIFSLSVGYTVHDKIAAQKKKRRVPEKLLFLIAFAGGALPMLITMLTVSHKTRHLRFMIGLPVIIGLQSALFVALTVLL